MNKVDEMLTWIAEKPADASNLNRIGRKVLQIAGKRQKSPVPLGTRLVIAVMADHAIRLDQAATTG